jgi:hypothetical protein
MAKDSILGDINPIPTNGTSGRAHGESVDDRVEDEVMEGGSRHDQSKHSGSRDVTEGVTGGLGTETGGTRIIARAPEPRAATSAIGLNKRDEIAISRRAL